MARTEYEMLFKLQAQMNSQFSGTFSSAQRSIIAMQKELDALNKTQSDISSFQKQQSAVEATQKKLEVLQQQYDNIQKEIKETGEYSSALENKLLSKQQQIDKTSASLSAQTEKLGQMGTALNKAGIDTSKLAEESQKLGAEYDDLKKKQEEAAEKAGGFGEKASAGFIAVGQAIVAAGVASALKEIADWYGQCIEASIVFESAMTGVAKTTDLTDAELAAMSEEIKALATKDIPMVTEELAGIMENAGQLGIHKENLLSFTRTMADLGVATNLTGEEAAMTSAKFANITKMSQEDVGRLGSTVVELGNNLATTEKDILSMALNLASAGKQAGLTEAEIVGLAGALSSVGMEAQAGGTAFSKAMNTILIAVETGSEDLDDFARVAGMTAQEFSRAWGDDAAGALIAFTKGLADTERLGASTVVLLDELGLTETRLSDALRRAAGSGDLFNNAIVTSNQAWEENIALSVEAEKRYATTESKLQMMKNSYNNLQIAVGDVFTPSLKEAYGIGTNVLNGLTEFVKQNPGVVKAVTALATVIGVATAALVAYSAVVKIVKALDLASIFTGPGAVIMGVVGAVATLATMVITLTEESKALRSEAQDLTAVSRAQYNELRDLNNEYERACEAYGETKYEAQSLSWQIEELTAEYQAGKQTLEEYKAAHESLMDSYREMNESHGEAYASTDKEANSIFALIKKLEDLSTTTQEATANKQAILAIVDSLNESVPNLALSYDDVVKATPNFISSLYATAKAQAAQKRLSDDWASYVERVTMADDLDAAAKFAAQQVIIATQEYNHASDALQDLYPGVDLNKASAQSKYGTKAQMDAAAAWREAGRNLKEYEGVSWQATWAVVQNNVAMLALENSMNGYQAETEDATAATQAISDYLGTVKAEVEELSGAYNKAYDSAFSSVQGQYDLWDKAADIVPQKTGDINKALDSQINYWQKYNENISTLTAKASDIEGLSDVIASFSDGSESSVNAIAGMAKASDKELSAMVTKWKTLQEEQDTVATSLADLETDFSETMAALQKNVEDTIREMDLNNEAAQSGKNTIQGFISGAENMLPAVRTAYYRVAQAARNALSGPSLPASVGIPGYATGTVNAPNMFIAGEQGPELIVGAQGSTVFPSEETQKILSAANRIQKESVSAITYSPQLMNYLNAAGVGAAPISADRGGSGANIEIKISPVYQISGNSTPESFAATMNDQNEYLRGLVIDALEQAGIDAARRSYQ